MRNQYKLLAEKYQQVNESWGWNGPENITWSRYNDVTKQKEPVATVVFDKGAPKDYKNLGWANSGIAIPKANDWLDWSTGMHTTHYLSPSLKVYYSVDSSD